MVTLAAANYPIMTGEMDFTGQGIASQGSEFTLVDTRGFLENMGVKLEIIHAGEHQQNLVK